MKIGQGLFLGGGGGGSDSFKESMAQGRTAAASPLFRQISDKLAFYLGNNLQTDTSVPKSELCHTVTAQPQNLAQRINTPSQIVFR